MFPLFAEFDSNFSYLSDISILSLIPNRDFEEGVYSFDNFNDGSSLTVSDRSFSCLMIAVR